jgi:uracil phosphoribosyltransferase/phosphoserine phosphatase/adenylate kinase
MPTDVSNSDLNHQLTLPDLETFRFSKSKPKVIGIYGIPGSGKTFLLNQLKQSLDREHFLFYEGSEVIAALVPGGLETFEKLDEKEKTHWRQLAIDTIGQRCANSGQIAIVTGHFMFWFEEGKEGCRVYTQNDLNTFTHILYLDVPTEVIELRHRDDLERRRPPVTTAHLSKWQQTEKSQLRCLCRDHGILFTLCASGMLLPGKVSTLLRDFGVHTDEYNLSHVEGILDKTLLPYQGRLETVLVMDADKTLTAEDTGTLFWRRSFESRGCVGEDVPLSSLFSGPLGYSYTAFRQATLLYEDVADDQAYDALCHDIASVVIMHPEFVSLLQLVAQQEHVGAVIVSCGLRRVWEKVLERYGLSKTVHVIAGGRIADGFVVTAAVKAAVVARLQVFHRLYVWAFGDSPLDLEMLKSADKAVVVVGDQRSRSKSMDAALSKAIDQDGLRALQVLLPSSVSPRLSTSKLPLADLNRIEFISDLIKRDHRPIGVPVFLAKDRNAAKLLATPMRDAGVSGPLLREVHRRVGWYLACEFVTRVIGVEECPISHVLGHHTIGYRLLHEEETTIVALMRAGEPMASGVNEAFPLAMYVHANSPGDIKPHHLRGRAQVVLVDSVVNSGKTVVEFVQAIRDLDTNVCIILLAGVVQAQCVSPTSTLYKTLSHYGNIYLIALRLSETKFTGSGTTDTGNRLFNTTHLK